MKRFTAFMICIAMIASLGTSAFAYGGCAKIPVYSAAATSELIEYGRLYSAWNLVDGDTSSCWAEGASGYGHGESFTIFFNGTYDVSRVAIVAGWAASDYSFEKNALPYKMRVTFSSSAWDYSYEFTLDYTSSVQSFWLDERDVDWVTFEILSVYTGYDGVYDTCVSEVAFYE